MHVRAHRQHAASLWSGGRPADSIFSQRTELHVIFYPPLGAGLQPERDVLCRVGSCYRATGQTVYEPATGSPTQFHAPTQRREGREYVRLT
jgi:hypothetical protein